MKLAVAFVVVFVATLAADYCWTRYNLHSAAKRAHLASAWSAGIVLCGWVNITSYGESRWLIIPALVGAYIGTWLAIHKENRADAAKNA